MFESISLYRNRDPRASTSAAGAAKGVRDEIGTLVKTQVERLVNNLNLVPREEFEAVKAMALKARKEVEELSARLEKMESDAEKK